MGKQSRKKKQRRASATSSPSTADLLRAIYDHVPNIKCKGLCHPTCASIPVQHVEYAHIVVNGLVEIDENHILGVQGGKHIIRRDASKGGVCPMLKDKRCSIHDLRPLICRIYGVAEGLACEFGCKSEGMITRKEVDLLIDELEQINKEVLDE